MHNRTLFGWHVHLRRSQFDQILAEIGQFGFAPAEPSPDRSADSGSHPSGQFSLDVGARIAYFGADGEIAESDVADLGALEAGIPRFVPFTNGRPPLRIFGRDIGNGAVRMQLVSYSDVWLSWVRSYEPDAHPEERYVWQILSHRDDRSLEEFLLDAAVEADRNFEPPPYRTALALWIGKDGPPDTTDRHTALAVLRANGLGDLLDGRTNVVVRNGYTQHYFTADELAP